MKYLLLFISIFLIQDCSQRIPKEKLVYETESLKIYELTSSIFRHESYLSTENFGKVSCNGMIYTNNSEAAVFDTPTSDSISLELIQYINKELDAEIVAIVANHFHIDCLGGIRAFQENEIPAYITRLGARLAFQDGYEIPWLTFDKNSMIKVGNAMVHNKYFGKAHTSDNIISYIPEEEIMFGGCMVKTIGAGKGNLNDASVQDWPETIKKIKSSYPTVKTIIPGHGAIGSSELLDYTISVFDK